MENLKDIALIAMPVITCWVTYIVTRLGIKNDKSSNILEEQYLKVVSPIHYILKTAKKKKLFTEIGNVVNENYHLLPEGLYDDFIGFTNAEISEQEFKNKIDEYNRILRYKLGYSKIKITKKDKEAEKQLAMSKNYLIIRWILTILSVLVGVCTSLLFDATPVV